MYVGSFFERFHASIFFMISPHKSWRDYRKPRHILVAIRLKRELNETRFQRQIIQFNDRSWTLHCFSMRKASSPLFHSFISDFKPISPFFFSDFRSPKLTRKTVLQIISSDGQKESFSFAGSFERIIVIFVKTLGGREVERRLRLNPESPQAMKTLKKYIDLIFSNLYGSLGIWTVAISNPVTRTSSM